MTDFCFVPNPEIIEPVYRYIPVWITIINDIINNKLVMFTVILLAFYFKLVTELIKNKNTTYKIDSKYTKGRLAKAVFISAIGAAIAPMLYFELLFYLGGILALNPLFMLYFLICMIIPIPILLLLEGVKNPKIVNAKGTITVTLTMIIHSILALLIVSI